MSVCLKGLLMISWEEPLAGISHSRGQSTQGLSTAAAHAQPLASCCSTSPWTATSCPSPPSPGSLVSHSRWICCVSEGSPSPNSTILFSLYSTTIPSTRSRCGRGLGRRLFFWKGVFSWYWTELDVYTCWLAPPLQAQSYPNPHSASLLPFSFDSLCCCLYFCGCSLSLRQWLLFWGWSGFCPVPGSLRDGRCTFWVFLCTWLNFFLVPRCTRPQGSLSTWSCTKLSRWWCVYRVSVRLRILAWVAVLCLSLLVRVVVMVYFDKQGILLLFYNKMGITDRQIGTIIKHFVINNNDHDNHNHNHRVRKNQYSV